MSEIVCPHVNDIIRIIIFAHLLRTGPSFRYLDQIIARDAGEPYVMNDAGDLGRRNDVVAVLNFCIPRD